MNDIIKCNKKNNQIQFLRAVFCFAILFYHFTYRYSEIYAANNIFYNSFVQQLSQVGLISFFIISGFYLIRRQPLNSNKEKLVYWIKRFLNIYIPYVFAVVFIFLLSLSGLLGVERTVSLIGFFQIFFFINIITGQNVDGAHWYIFALLCLYVIAFIYDMIPKNENKEYLIFWIIVLSVSIISLLVQKLASDDSLFIKPFKIISYVMCRSYFLFVFVGITFYFFDYDIIRCKRNLLLLISMLITVMYVLYNNWIDFVIMFFSSLIIFMCLLRKFTVLEKIKPVVFLGNISFSLYLIHQNTGYMCLNFMTKYLNYYISLFITIMVILIIGSLFYFLFEKNIKKLLSFIK